jgi:PKD repeat protein
MKVKPGSHYIVYAVTDTQYFKSTDMGNTWTNISAGLSFPVGNWGLRVAVSAADTNTVYIATTNGYGEIFKSADGGNTFNMVYSCDTQCIVCYDSTITSGSQGDYNFTFNVNPTNANELLLGSQCVWRSTDGGQTWSWRTQWWNQIHTDMHDIEFDPYDVNIRFNGNDGGVWMSTDTLATTWQPMCNGLAATEMYHAAQSPVTRQLIDIGSQDNGEMYYNGIWMCNRGGDWGARCGMDYLTHGTVYYDDGTRRNLSPLGGTASYNPPFATTPSYCIEFSRALPDVAFIGTDSLWVSTNINATSPTWTLLHTLNENIWGISACKADTNLLYYVTNNNHLVRIVNSGGWSPTITVLTTPGTTNVAASVATDKYNANVVYLSCNGSVYRSTNKGATWTNITGALPGLNILKVIEDEYSPRERIFACEGNYVYWRDTVSTAWTLTTGLPSIMQITDFMVYNDSAAGSVLRLSTYGRGVWENSINSNYPPDAGYTVNKQYLCPGDTVQFDATVFGSYTSLEWNFPGGVPATSTADSPIVTYATTGTYNVTLTAYGPYGNDTVLRTGYIVVSNGTTSLLSEGFEESFFPPLQWTLQSQSGVNWQQAGVGSASAHSAYFDNFDNSTSGAHDRLVSQQIDISHTTGVFVTFDVAYSYYGPGYNDTLQVEYSTDCGRTFIPVYIKDSSILATAPTIDSVGFVPTATEWRNDTVWVPSGGPGIMIAFDNIGHYGQNIYIDNVNMHATPDKVSNLNLADKIMLYPNPTTNMLTISGSGINANTATLVCTNILGIKQWERSISLQNEALNTTVDIHLLPIGNYIVTIILNDGSAAHYAITKE